MKSATFRGEKCHFSGRIVPLLSETDVLSVEPAGLEGEGGMEGGAEEGALERRGAIALEGYVPDHVGEESLIFVVDYLEGDVHRLFIGGEK